MCFNNLMINTYLLLFTAIVFEVAGTMMLPLSQNFTKVFPTAFLIASYCLSFYLLAIVSTKLPLSVVTIDMEDESSTERRMHQLPNLLPVCKA